MKKLLSVILALTLGATALSAQKVRSGALNKTISWTLADSVLTLTGTGKTPSYNSTSILHRPWQDERFAAEVKKIVVGEGITEIGSYTFGAREVSRASRDQSKNTYYNTQDATTTALFMNIEEVQLPSTLRKIGSHAFVRMPLTHICFPESLEEIGSGAFSNADLRMIILPPNLRRLGPEAFGSCQNLRAIDFNGLPLKLSLGLFWGAERLRMMLHTFNIRSVEPSTFNATPFGTYREDVILDMFHSDGIHYYLDSYLAPRGSFSDDREYEQAHNLVADRFYEREAANATSLFDLDRLTLLPYNPETGTVTFTTCNHGAFLVSLSAEQAAELSARWDEVRKTAQPVFKPANGRVYLQSVTLFLGSEVLAAAPIR